MNRASAFLCILAASGFQPAFGQQQAQPEDALPLVYEAFYAIDYGSVTDWTEQFRAYSVPVLQELREEGLIRGWSYWRHQTGGDGYNFRLAVLSNDWAAFDTFWSEYLSRLRTAMPEGEWSASSAMIDRHRDAIWDVEAEGWAEEASGTTHLYASTFRVDFSDIAEWNEIWADVAVPILDETTDEGLLRGWVQLGHNTGGDHNFKILYFFTDWDDIDDFFTRFSGTLADEHPIRFARLNDMLREHDDTIWIPAPPAIEDEEE